ncbi:MAG: hypothetical protein K8R23_18335 [Chthoniobacter sp.]|nr:hypothetical protein [Chthoniobacter sp.]
MSESINQRQNGGGRELANDAAFQRKLADFTRFAIGLCWFGAVLAIATPVVYAQMTRFQMDVLFGRADADRVIVHYLKRMAPRLALMFVLSVAGLLVIAGLRRKRVWARPCWMAICGLWVLGGLIELALSPTLRATFNAAFALVVPVYSCRVLYSNAARRHFAAAAQCDFSA